MSQQPILRRRIRLAKLAGATTIATTRDQKKVSLLKANGADHVVVTGGDDALAIRKLTDGRGVDGAVDYTGSNSVMKLCCESMRLGGSICLTFGEPGSLPFTAWDMNRLELTVRGVRGGTPADQLVVWELMNRGVLRIPVERVLPLSEASEAHALQEAGSLAGRIVLRPWP